MSSISLRLPESLHESARRLAAQENVSLNQLITLALAEKMSALMTQDILDARARRGSRKKFERVLKKVPKTPPDAHDRLP